MTRLRSAIVCWLVPAVVGVIAVAIARFVGLRASPAVEWPLLFLTFAVASALWIRMRAERAYRPESIMSAISSLTAGQTGSEGRCSGGK